jgi:hypothetical protein
MNMPGFSAEASLYNGNVRYQATAGASSDGGIVQPAHAIEFDPNAPIPTSCLAYRCRYVIVSIDRLTGIPRLEYRCGFVWIC